MSTQLLDKLGRARTPATLGDLRRGKPAPNAGKRYRGEVYQPGEVLALINAQSETSASGLRHRALIALLWRSGLRIQEALDLEIRDLNFGAATLHVRHGKGDKERRVVMDPFGWEFIAPWLARRGQLDGVNSDHGLVFCVTDGPSKGDPLNQAQVRTMLQRTARKIGMTIRVHPHGFRHTHAVECYEENIDMRVIQAQLGHASLAITSHYLNHLSPKMQFEAISQRPAPAWAVVA